jgi:sulfite exporter TauE/SafE
MEHCHHEIVTQISYSSLLLDMFITGIVGSFMHCIGMCGPLAIAQVSMRIMNIPAHKVNEMEKLKAVAIFPYYFGKAATYSLLGVASFLLKDSLKEYQIFNYLAVIVLMVSAAYFFINSINSKDLFDRFSKLYWLKNINKWLTKKSQHLKPYGIQGFFLGMSLGLLPCGLVVSMVISATTLASNVGMVALAMFTFGLATVPGLFITSYLGISFIKKYQKYYNVIYSMIMLLNCFLMIRYALKLI